MPNRRLKPPASSKEEVRIEILVAFGGSFFVALSSSEAKEEEMLVCIAAEVALRYIEDECTFVTSSAICGWARLSSDCDFVFKPACEALAVSRAKKDLKEDGSFDPYDSEHLVIDACDCGFHPMALMKDAAIWVLIRSTPTTFIRPSFVLASRSRGSDICAAGDDFFRRDSIW